jgi:biotin operon repressor
LPYGYIADRLRDLTGEYPSVEAIRSAAKRARRVGFEIEAVYGVGYRLRPDLGREDAFMFKDR